MKVLGTIQLIIVTKIGHTYNSFTGKAEDFGADKWTYNLLPKKGIICTVLKSQLNYKSKISDIKFGYHKDHQYYLVRCNSDGQQFILGPDAFDLIETNCLPDELFEV